MNLSFNQRRALLRPHPHPPATPPTWSLTRLIRPVHSSVSERVEDAHALGILHQVVCLFVSLPITLQGVFPKNYCTSRVGQHLRSGAMASWILVLIPLYGVLRAEGKTSRTAT